MLKLAPGEWQRFALRVTCGAGGSESWGVRRYYQTLRAVRHDLRSCRGRAAQITGSNARFNELAGRSLSDLYMLVTETEHGPYPFAGIPWYSTVFGRDGIITALMTLWLDPTIARGVSRFLAATQTADIDRETMPSPARSCMKCVAARWLGLVKCRSAAITAASMRRPSMSY